MEFKNLLIYRKMELIIYNYALPADLLQQMY